MSVICVSMCSCYPAGAYHCSCTCCCCTGCFGNCVSSSSLFFFFNFLHNRFKYACGLSPSISFTYSNDIHLLNTVELLFHLLWYLFLSFFFFFFFFSWIFNRASECIKSKFAYLTLLFYSHIVSVHVWKLYPIQHLRHHSFIHALFLWSLSNFFLFIYF